MFKQIQPRILLLKPNLRIDVQMREERGRVDDWLIGAIGGGGKESIGSLTPHHICKIEVRGDGTTPLWQHSCILVVLMLLHAITPPFLSSPLFSSFAHTNKAITLKMKKAKIHSLPKVCPLT